jgi:hypothetical protein
MGRWEGRWFKKIKLEGNILLIIKNLKKKRESRVCHI